jgi:hypothetical protein
VEGLQQREENATGKEKKEPQVSGVNRVQFFSKLNIFKP